MAIFVLLHAKNSKDMVNRVYSFFSGVGFLPYRQAYYKREQIGGKARCTYFSEVIVIGIIRESRLPFPDSNQYILYPRIKRYSRLNHRLHALSSNKLTFLCSSKPASVIKNRLSMCPRAMSRIGWYIESSISSEGRGKAGNSMWFRTKRSNSDDKVL